MDLGESEGSLFSTCDYECVRDALGILSTAERKAIVLRYWGNLSIFQVAREIRVSWERADAIINRALEKLQTACLNDPSFSRTTIEQKAVS